MSEQRRLAAIVSADVACRLTVVRTGHLAAADLALGLRGCPCRSACRRPQARAPSWLSSMANVIHAPAIDRQHLGRDEAGIRLDQESHGGGNVLRRANPTDHGALAH